MDDQEINKSYQANNLAAQEKPYQPVSWLAKLSVLQLYRLKRCTFTFLLNEFSEAWVKEARNKQEKTRRYPNTLWLIKKDCWTYQEHCPGCKGYHKMKNKEESLDSSYVSLLKCKRSIIANVVNQTSSFLYRVWYVSGMGTGGSEGYWPEDWGLTPQLTLHSDSSFLTSWDMQRKLFIVLYCMWDK